MTLDFLTLHDFRCFTRAEFRPAPGLNLLAAPNASGKSSILEAICVLLRLQSPRAGALAETIRHGTPGLSVAGRCGDRELRCHLSREEGRKLLLDSGSSRFFPRRTSNSCAAPRPSAVVSLIFSAASATRAI